MIDWYAKWYRLKEKWYYFRKYGVLFPNRAPELKQIQMVLEDPNNIRLMSYPSEEVQMTAVTRWAQSIHWIDNPTPSVQKYVAQTNLNLLRMIRNPCPEIKELLLIEEVNRQ